MNWIKIILRRIYYLKSFINFKTFGKNIILGPGGLIARPNEISLGNNIYISRNFFISARNLTFGNNIMIGPNLVIECDNHTFNKIGFSMFAYSNERSGSFVTIENDVWIGTNATILANVKISEGAIIGAGSLVNKTLPPYTICVGVPCRPIKTRFTLDELKIHLQKINSIYDVEMVSKEWSIHNLIL